MKLLRLHFTINRLKTIKETVVAIGIPLLLVMAIHANAVQAQQSNRTNDIVTNQNRLLDSNATLLTAINNAVIDNHITSDQKANLIICMLQVPISERTTDMLNNCRNQAAIVTPPARSGNSAGTTQNSAGNASSASPSQGSTAPPATQPNNSHPTYTQCIGAKTGLLHSVLGVVTCL